MRFRAWHKSEKKMYNVFVINLFDRSVICSENKKFFMEEVILMRFTGFETVDDDIYVGDIVKYGEHYYKVVEHLNTSCLVRLNGDYIEYDDFEKSIYSCGESEPSFQGMNHDYIVSLFDIACNMNEIEEILDCEVVGNIYENLEEYLMYEVER